MNHPQAQPSQPSYTVETGPLAKTYGLFVPSSINTGAQISADRIADKDLRNMGSYTANAPLAIKREGKLLLGMGGNSAFNVVFGENTGKVCQQLIDSHYVHLTPHQRDLILMLERAGEVVFVEPKDLSLKGNEPEYRFFPIRTGSFQRDITIARTPFVNAGYGSGDMLRRVMVNLRVNGNISETTVYTMNPEHVAENVTDDEIVARASWLGSFNYDSNFYAVGGSVNYRNGLRGVPGKPAEGGTQKPLGLEGLAGKGTSVGNGLVVVREDQITPEERSLLMGNR